MEIQVAVSMYALCAITKCHKEVVKVYAVLRFNSVLKYTILYSKIDKTKILLTDGSLIQVKGILQYF